MDNVKPWQVVLIVAAVGVLGFSVWKFALSDGLEAQMVDSVYMVDVGTGQIYEFNITGRRGVMIPGKNPDTGKYSLMPVQQTENGSWTIDRADLDSLRFVDGDATAIDRGTGVATVSDNPPIKVSN